MTDQEIQANERMFKAAILDLAAIAENLGLDPEQGGAAPIIQAIEELRRGRDEWVDAGFAASRPVDDLAVLVRRLAHSLREASPGSDLADKAVDYLRRHGLDGEPLRANYAACCAEGGGRVEFCDCVHPQHVHIGKHP